MRNSRGVLTVAGATLAVCPVATFVGARGALGLVLGGVLGIFALAAPFIAAFGILEGPGTGRRRFLATVAAAGVACGIAAALWFRGDFAAGVLGMGAALFLILPALAIGLFTQGLSLGKEREVGYVTSSAHGFVLAASLAVATGVGGGHALYRWDLRCAKRWVESVADVVRAEHARTGQYPKSLKDVGLPTGRRPRLLRSGEPSYRPNADGFKLSFQDDVTTMIDPDIVEFDGVARRWTRRAT